MKARHTALEAFRYPPQVILGVRHLASNPGREVVWRRLELRAAWKSISAKMDISVYQLQEMFKETVTELVRLLDDRAKRGIIPSPHPVGNKHNKIKDEDGKF